MTRAYLQILGTSGDTTPSIFLFTDNVRLLFNAGEGTQRLCIENKFAAQVHKGHWQLTLLVVHLRVRLGRLTNIFTTQAKWRCQGGLPGLILSIHETLNGFIQTGGRNSPPVAAASAAAPAGPEVPPRNLMPLPPITGPVGLSRLIGAARPFLGRLSPPLREISDHTQEFTHGNVSVTALLLRPEGRFHPSRCRSRSASPESPRATDDRAHGPDDAYLSSGSDTPDTSRSPPRKVRVLGGVDRDVAICYVCKIEAPPGKMLQDRIKSLAIPKGPWLADLKAGKPITLSDGRVVQPHDVLGPQEPSPLFAIVDCPTAAHLPALHSHRATLSREAFAARGVLRAVVHLAPPEVLGLPDYQAWMKEAFPLEADHVIVHENVCAPAINFRAATECQILLNLVKPDMFPALSPLSGGGDSGATPLKSSPIVGAVVAAPKMKVSLWPLSEAPIDYSDVLSPPNARDIRDKALAVPGMTEALALAHGSALATSAAPPVPGQCAHKLPAGGALLFLGTGSSKPSLNRNVSSFLLTVPAAQSPQSNVSILFDCGEGTLGQLHQCVGAAGTETVLRDLVAVSISHLHADHHLGLVRLLLARGKLSPPPPQPLVVIGPPSIRKWLGRFCDIEVLSYIMVDCAALDSPEAPLPAALVQAGMVGFHCVPVDHCSHAYGNVVTHAAGWKMVYSGDTRPCAALVAAGRGADLLVHEATFEDSLAADAVTKRHCTTAEALAVSRDMQAKVLLLTHFSQRYPKLPVLDDAAARSTGFAFDYMRIPFAQLQCLPAILPALQLLFAVLPENDD